MQPDTRNRPPSIHDGEEDNDDLSPSDQAWEKRAKSAFQSSTMYVDANYRKQWDDSIRAFNNQHSGDSKYSQPAFDKRSKVFRPKTRSVIRKNEAAAAAAFFSNMDVVSVAPQDQSNKAEVASSEIMKQLLQHRLTKSIAWYQVVLGGIQDAQTIGAVCAHIYWEYKERPELVQEAISAAPIEDSSEGDDEDPEGDYPVQGELPSGAFAVEVHKPEKVAIEVEHEAVYENKPYVDKPCVELIPIENIRIDPGASWVDPIRSSPYVIHLMPMYVMDVKTKMKLGDWKRYGDDVIIRACDNKSDSTRSERNRGRDDPYSSSDKSISDYEICWVQRHIHRKDDRDYEFYMLGEIGMLTKPVLLSENVFHGERPYVMGTCLIETHKIYPSGIPQLGKGLQEEANEIANQRLDNVKFVLNKKFLVRRGVQADLSGLVRNVPGGVVLTDNPNEDVKELNWPDVTGSSFEEQNRINMDMDELLGNFNPAALIAAGGAMNAPARNMNMLSQSNGTLVEYLIRTYVETFVQPVLRQIIKLEQCYESDKTVLAIAAKQAQLFQKYGIDEVTDELLNNELTLTVNVGMGATDPQQKLGKFLTAMGQYTNMLQKPVPGINMQEVGKEIFGHLGYSDGTRFFTNDNPQIQMLQQQVQQLMSTVNQLQAKLKEKGIGHVTKLQATRETNQTKIVTEKMKQENENKRALATHYRQIMSEQHDLHLNLNKKVS